MRARASGSSFKESRVSRIRYIIGVCAHFDNLINLKDTILPILNQSNANIYLQAYMGTSFNVIVDNHKVPQL